MRLVCELIYRVVACTLLRLMNIHFYPEVHFAVIKTLKNSHSYRLPLALDAF
jgi:hypothetical protein